VTRISTAKAKARVKEQVRRKSGISSDAEQQISHLIADAAELFPQAPKIEILKKASAKCRACDLWKHATQTVFGDGSPSAAVVFIGEQPGDREDIEGRPFVGPAGKLLQQAILEAGIDPNEAYLTNVVKHFRWMTSGRGKRRIHKKPRQSEIDACRPWFESELSALAPEVLVCLGATAAKSLLGNDFSVRRQRGNFVPSPVGPAVLATIHPSSILRSPDSDTRHTEMQAFVRDLRKGAQFIDKTKKKSAEISRRHTALVSNL
jgi:DNA polymerase